jgi:hypothetical protein
VTHYEFDQQPGRQSEPPSVQRKLLRIYELCIEAALAADVQAAGVEVGVEAGQQLDAEGTRPPGEGEEAA